MSVTQQATELEVISGILRPSAFACGFLISRVRGPFRGGDIVITIATPSVELDLRGRCGTVFQHPNGFPD
jgi:hypothetical protein